MLNFRIIFCVWLSCVVTQTCQLMTLIFLLQTQKRYLLFDYENGNIKKKYIEIALYGRIHAL